MSVAALLAPLPQVKGIDPRVFFYLERRWGLNNKDERREDEEVEEEGEETAGHQEEHRQQHDDVSSTAQEDGAEPVLQLPIRMVFRWMWKGHDNEHYPIEADLLEVDGNKMIHHINYNPHFADRFNGKHFTRLSNSSLYIKPTEANGFISWYYRNEQGQLRTMKEARARGFANPLVPRPPLIMPPRMTKDMLLRESDMTQRVHHDLERGKQGAGGRRRRRRPVVSTVPAMPLGFSMQQQVLLDPHNFQWTMAHSVKVLVDYMVEVLPGMSNHILLSDVGIFRPVHHFVSQLPLHAQNILATATASPFLLLGSLILWWHKTSQRIPDILLGTECSNITNLLNTRVRPREFVVAAAEWLATFTPKQCFQLRSFDMSQEHISIYRHDVFAKSVQITDMLDEIACVRHVDLAMAKIATHRELPVVFTQVLCYTAGQ